MCMGWVTQPNLFELRNIYNPSNQPHDISKIQSNQYGSGQVESRSFCQV